MDKKSKGQRDGKYNESATTLDGPVSHMRNGSANICRLCRKRYDDKTSLMTHIEIHHKKGAHTCIVCKAEFFLKTALQKHMEKHTNLVYVCILCSKTFNREASLSLHLDNHMINK